MIFYQNVIRKSEETHTRAEPARAACAPTSGFTLVEMLVVFAILAILLTLLFPAFSGAREKANNAKCVSNLRRMGAGLMLYVSEHDGALIPGAIASTEGGLTMWFNALDAYMGDEEGGKLSNFTSGNRPAWQRCPSKVFTKSEMQQCTVGYGWNYYGYGGSGGFGMYPDDKSHPGGKGGSSLLSQVTKPSQTFIIADSKDLDVQRTAVGQNLYLYPPPASSWGVLRAKRHSGRGNYLMVDGHVESLTPDLTGYDSYFLKVK